MEMKPAWCVCVWWEGPNPLPSGGQVEAFRKQHKERYPVSPEERDKLYKKQEVTIAQHTQ